MVDIGMYKLLITQPVLGIVWWCSRLWILAGSIESSTIHKTCMLDAMVLVRIESDVYVFPLRNKVLSLSLWFTCFLYGMKCYLCCLSIWVKCFLFVALYIRWVPIWNSKLLRLPLYFLLHGTYIFARKYIGFWVHKLPCTQELITSIWGVTYSNICRPPISLHNTTLQLRNPPLWLVGLYCTATAQA